jgi:pimeloyl-ACP methyl ester carboxylesterase
VSACQSPRTEVPKVRFEACPASLARVDARCGVMETPENPDQPDGRRIGIHFVVLKAKQPNGRAIYFNPGGPGAATIPLAAALAAGKGQKEIAALNDTYDILLVDNRGIGASHSLQCDYKTLTTLADRFRQLWPDTAMKTCRDAHAKDSDLDQYTTVNAMNDLDRLRGALGYSKLVMDGDSYGTYDALVFMRLHPEHTESAVLDGVAPPHFLTVPLEDAAGAQLAMDGLIATCAKDAACHARYPDFAQRFAAVVARFDKESVQTPLVDHGAPVMLSREVFDDRLRQSLYDAPSAAYVPFVIDRAYDGDYGPLAQMINVTTDGITGFVEVGSNLAYVCAEQLPFITEAAVKKTSANSFEGDTRVRAEQRACAIWRVAKAPDAVYAPVRSDIPVLMVSGSDDPASPPQAAADELPLLPNGKRVLVMGAGHVNETPCTDALKIAFVRAGSAKGLDVDKCSADFKRPPFATSMRGFGP